MGENSTKLNDEYIFIKQCDTACRPTTSKVYWIIIARPIKACKVTIKLAISGNNAAKLC